MLNRILKRTPRGSDQRGQSVIIFALAAVVLFGFAAIAVDQGMAMADRRNIQAAADGASLAGTRQYSLGGDVNYAHFVAVQYLVASVSSGGGMPVGCTTKVSCGDGPFTVGTYSFSFTDTGTILDVAVSHARTPLLAGALGVTQETVGTGARARPVGPLIIGASYNVAALYGTFNIDGGGTCNPSGTITGNVYSDGPFGSNNHGHCHPTQVPTQVAGFDASGNIVTCTGASAANTQVDFGPNGSSQDWGFFPTPAIVPGTPTHTNVTQPLAFDQDPPRPPSIVYTFATRALALDLSGNWKPGTYNGFVPNPTGPSTGKLTGGVYKITNVPNPDVSAVVQYNAHSSNGNPAGSDAVAIVLNSTDTGSLTIGRLILNGYENAVPIPPLPPVDPAGTHNFVLYGGPSNTTDPTHSGFQGAISSLGPADSPNLTGILYMPNSSLSSHGNPDYQFNGAVYMHDYNLDGGGNGAQGFRFICGLASIAGKPTDGGLVR